MSKLAAVLAAALLAAGCAAGPVAPALFVVVPASDGHVGQIVVERCGESRLVNTAYGAQRLGADGRVQATRLSAAEVRRDFGATLDALPGRPASFMLYFHEGSDELIEASKDELQKVFAELQRRPLPDIVVIGHTDTVGAQRYNDELSRARAERLRDILVSHGLPAPRIQTAGRGEREPLVPTGDNVSEPRNRRVEINVR